MTLLLYKNNENWTACLIDIYLTDPFLTKVFDLEIYIIVTVKSWIEKFLLTRIKAILVND